MMVASGQAVNSQSLPALELGEWAVDYIRTFA
jgi:hypothetical protein